MILEKLVDNKLRSFIRQHISGKVEDCHQATYSILSYAITNKAALKDPYKSTSFEHLLQDNYDKVVKYDAKKSIPLHLYDVFGFFTQEGSLLHSAIVVSKAPSNIIAEQDNNLGRVIFNRLNDSIIVDLFKPYRGNLYNICLYPIEVTKTYIKLIEAGFDHNFSL